MSEPTPPVRRWPIFAIIALAELLFVVGVLRAWPDRMQGTGSWGIWIALLVLNIFLAQLVLGRRKSS